jgi:hypothetical protein
VALKTELMFQIEALRENSHKCEKRVGNKLTFKKLGFKNRMKGSKLGQ